MDRVGVLGLGRSGRAAAHLALVRGYEVFASDSDDCAATLAAVEVVRAGGGSAEAGGHTMERLAECDILVVSPGIPPTADVLRDERLQAVPRISELEFAFRHLTARVVGVTGTNGKTTTTALTAALLLAAGVDAVAAGNIGLALSEVAAWEDGPEWVVVEASSYQLAAIQRFRPDIGVFTNLSPDHLDRYPDVDSYYADKRRFFENATVDSVWVLNGDDDLVLRMAEGVPGRTLLFQLAFPAAEDAEGGFLDDQGRLVVRVGGVEHALLDGSELRLLGIHNRANALAATLAAYVIAPQPAALADGLRAFRAPPHRLEPVGEHRGVLWVNDSKATNVASTRMALESMERPVVLMLGGRHKGEPYTTLADLLKRRARAVVAFGEARGRIAEELGEAVELVVEDGPFEAVVKRAAALAQAGDAVLLSPACSSFDMFRDFEDRGERFRALVHEMRGRGGDA